MFRVGELRRHHLIEASVRAYCLRHERFPLGGCSQDPSVGRVEIETTHFSARNLSLLHPDDTLGPHILMSLPQVIVHKLDKKSPLVPPEPAWYDSDGYSHSSTGAIENEETKLFLSDRDAEIIVLLEGTDELTGSALQARHSYRVGDIAWDHGFAPCVFPNLSQEQANQDRWSWLRQRNCEFRVGVPACTIDFSKFHNIVRVPPNCDTCAFIPQ
jgi:hypothetical protein